MLSRIYNISSSKLRILCATLLVCQFAAANAQDFDMQTLSEIDLIGTARYVGMGGAMTAVGGDESAVRDNPASLGVMRRSQVALSLAWQQDATGVGNQRPDKVNSFSAPSAALVFSFGNDERYTGVVRSNIMISYQLLKNFARQGFYDSSLLNRQSLAQAVANITSSNPYRSSLHTYLEKGGSDMYYDADIGWLSALMASEHVIETYDSGNSWSATGRQTYSDLFVNELGSNNEFTLAWSLNISNQWFLGVGLNVLSLNYSKTSYFNEGLTAANNTKYSLVSNFSANSTLVIGSIGLIAHPIEQLRLGISFISPSAGRFNIRNYSTLGNSQTPINTYNISNYPLPLRTSVGAAYQFSTNGLISIQYNYAHKIVVKSNPADAISDVHGLHAGAEWRAYKRMYLRAGYAYEWLSKNMSVLQPHYADTRTDLDYRLGEFRHYATFGIGYRGRYFNVEGAYRFRLSQADLYTYFRQETPLRMSSLTNGIVLTIAWHN